MARVEVVPWSIARMCVVIATQKGGEARRSIHDQTGERQGRPPRWSAPPLCGRA